MIKEYLKAVRINLSLYLLLVVFGALYSVSFDIFKLDLIKLLLILISFQIFYSAIYMINDLFDYKFDIKNSAKNWRPIIKGTIKRKNAFFVSIGLLIVGMFLSFLVSKDLLFFEIFFFLYNLMYGIFLKKIPYLGTGIAGITLATRFAMGAELFGGFNSYYLFFSIFMLSSANHFEKRLKEMKYDEEVRHPNKYHSASIIKLIFILFFILISIMAFLSNGIEQLFVVIVLLVYIIMVGGYIFSKFIRKLSEKVMHY